MILRSKATDHVFHIGKCCKLISSIFAKMATFYIFMTRSESNVLVGPCALFIFRTKALLEMENVVLGIHTPLTRFIRFASPYMQLIFRISLDVEIAFLLYLQKHHTSKSPSSVPQRNTDCSPFFWQLFWHNQLLKAVLVKLK